MAILGAAVIGAALALRYNRKIEETIAAGVMLITIILYASGRICTLTPGYICAYVMTGAALIYCILRFIKDRASFKDSVFTPGGLAFLFYLVFFAYFAYHRDFSHPDEFYCWGLMAKDYYTYGTMYSPLSTAMAGDTTPFLPLWNAFSAHMWFGFSDSLCYFAQHMFTISLLLPVFAHIKSRMTTLRWFVWVMMLPSVLLISGMDGFKYILGDMVLAAALCFFVIQAVSLISLQEAHAAAGPEERSGKLMSRIFDERVYHHLACALSLMSLCLIKRVGFIFAGLAILCVIAVYMRILGLTGTIRSLGLYALCSSLIAFTWIRDLFDCVFLFPVVIVLIGIPGYMLLDRLYNRTSVSRGLIHAVSIIAALGVTGAYTTVIISHRYGAYGNAVMTRFMSDLFSFSVDSGYLCLSYGVFILLLALAALYLRGKNELHKDLCIWTCMSMIIYILIMLYLQVSQIGPMNDYRESFIPRYIIPWEILAAFVILFVFVIDKADLSALMLTVSFVTVMLISDTGSFYGDMFARHRCVGYHALEDAGIELEPGDLVYFVDEQNSFSYTDREFYYRMSPAKTNFIDQIFYGNNGRIKMSAQELEADLANDRYLNEPYDYLYLQTCDDDFAERYGSLFDDPADIATGSAYYVISDGDGVVLKPVR